MDMDDEDLHCLQRIARLQAYPIGCVRARQLYVELEEFGALLREKVPALAFDDQPADFLAVQLSATSRV